MALEEFRKAGDNLAYLRFSEDKISHIFLARVDNDWYQFPLDLSTEIRCVASKLMMHHFVPPIVCVLPEERRPYHTYKRFDRVVIYYRNNIIAEVYWPDVYGQYTNADDIVERVDDTGDMLAVDRYVGRRSVIRVERIPRTWTIISAQKCGTKMNQIIEGLFARDYDDRASDDGVRQAYLWGDKRLQRRIDIS